MGAHQLESAEGESSQDTMNTSQRGALTLWRAQMEKQGQDTKSMGAGKGTSRPGEPRRRGKAGHGKMASHPGTRGTHFLESPDGETDQNTERMRANEGHSQT